MLSYRRIESERSFARQLWRAKLSAPSWYRKADDIWTPTYKSFLKFWNNCAEIWGLFDDEKLLACVYLEFYSPVSVNIHVSVAEKFERKIMVRFFSSLRRHKQREGVKSMHGWIFARNRALLAIARESGFVLSGLKMMFGSINGREVVWLEVRG